MSGFTVSKDLSGLLIPAMPMTLPVEFEEAISRGMARFILILVGLFRLLQKGENDAHKSICTECVRSGSFPVDFAFSLKMQ